MTMGVQGNYKAIIATVVTGILVLYAGYSLVFKQEGVVAAAQKYYAKLTDMPKEDASALAGSKFSDIDINKIQLDQALPPEYHNKEENGKVIIQAKNIKIEMTGEKPLTVYYKEGAGKADKVPILLLHGMSFSSLDWDEIQTLQIASRLGHRVVAVDLPGYGQTGGSRKLSNKGNFVDLLIGALGLGSPIIVSPSMSGSFALPFMLGDYTHKAAGYIPVAPGNAGDFKPEQYSKIKVPVLILYGSQDVYLGESTAKHLKGFSNNRVHVFKDAGHPCYMNKPDEWHQVFYDFLALYE